MSHTPDPIGADTAAAPTGGRLAASTRSTLLGAVFLMATSAVGPGFITQTTTFTVQLGAAFAFAIVISILIDIFAGAFNGLLLPLGIAVLLWVATRRADLLGGYRYPRWLLAVGWAAWLLTLYLAVNSVRPVIDLFS